MFQIFEQRMQKKLAFILLSRDKSWTESQIFEQRMQKNLLIFLADTLVFFDFILKHRCKDKNNSIYTNLRNAFLYNLQSLPSSIFLTPSPPGKATVGASAGNRLVALLAKNGAGVGPTPRFIQSGHERLALQR